MNGIEAALSGRIGQTPELRTSKAGKPWCSVNVAVDAADNGDREARPTWVSVACFGDTAERIALLEKGTRIYVEGALKLNNWTDKDGRERNGLQVSARVIQPLGLIGRRRSAQPKARDSEDLGTARPDTESPIIDAHSEPIDAIPF